MLVNQLGFPGDLMNQVGLFAEDDGVSIVLHFADISIFEYVRASGDFKIAGGFKAGKTLRS